VPLYALRGPPPDDCEVFIDAPSPMAALCGFHREAWGFRAVFPRGQTLIFRDPEHQRMVAGTWTITRQQVNGEASASVIVEIPPPAGHGTTGTDRPAWCAPSRPAMCRLAGVGRPEGLQAQANPSHVLPNRNTRRGCRVFKLAHQPVDLLSLPLNRTSRPMARNCEPVHLTPSLKVPIGHDRPRNRFCGP
jgi:hypothetical protein